MINQLPIVSKRQKIRIWIDFVCPYCLLGETVIARALEGIDIDVEWMPFELRPFPTPTLRPEGDYLPTAWKNGVYPTAEKLGVPIQLPTVSPQPYTRKAFLGLQYAAAQGKGSEYADAVLRAFFQADRDIGDTDVLCDIAGTIGLTVKDFTAALDSTDAAETHDRQLQEAQLLGIRAVPSVQVGQRLFSGTPAPDTLRTAVLAHIGKQAVS